MGFGANGSVSTGSSVSGNVLFEVRSSKDELIRSYVVPAAEADSFKLDLAQVQSSMGSSEPYHLVRKQQITG